QKISRGEKIGYAIKAFSPSSAESEEEVREMLEIDRECFTRSISYTFESLLKELRSPQTFCFLAQDPTSGKMLGMLWGKLEVSALQGRILHIYGIGRRAHAARLGIAEKLFSAFKQHQRNLGCRALLEVRPSNEV